MSEIRQMTPRTEAKVLQLLGSQSRGQLRKTCEALVSYDLTLTVETKLQAVAETNDLVSVRKAARKTLLSHWSRSREKTPKPDARQINDHLECHGISAFYHLTTKENWESIQATGGILSRAALARRGIKASFVADRGRDELCGTDEWVHLCLHPNQPMFYRLIPKQRRDEFVVLDVSAEVAQWNSTVFADENAVFTRAKLGPRLEDLQNLDLKCFAYGMFTRESKSAWQAEVLVHPTLPVGMITRVRPYPDVLAAHQENVPAAAKIDFMMRQFES